MSNLHIAMLNISESDYYKRNLPHLQPSNAEYFVTFRLKGSLPQKVVQRLKKEQELIKNDTKDLLNLTPTEKAKRNNIFKQYEELLDSSICGPTWLKKAEVAAIVEEAILFRNDRNYNLYAFTIMSNHIHLVFKLLQNENNSVRFPVTKIVGELKSYSAQKCNEKLGRAGAFWQNESYDHVIRDTDELERTIKYVLNNPVKAGMVEVWNDWKFTYCKPGILKALR